MSGSNWGVRVAAVGCVAAILFIVWGLSVSIYSMGWSSGLHQAEADGYAAKYPADTEKRIAQCLNGGFSPDSAKCIEEAIASSHESQRGEQDLQAQRDMSEWAFWMLVIAGASLAVTILGTVFLAWQVKLTREAVDDTSEATKAMMRQNELTEHAQRPWLSIDAKPKKLARKGNALGVEIDIITRNVGQMVAANYQLRFKFEWVASSIDPFKFIENVLSGFDPGDAPSRKVVLPKDEEIFPFWAYKAVRGTKPEHFLFGETGNMIGIFIISAFYKTHEADGVWHRTDKAYVVGWESNGRFASVVTDKFRQVSPNKLRLKAMLSATLAD